MLLLAVALAAAPCPTPPFAGWDRPVPVAADAVPALPVGRAARVRLRPAAEVRFAVPPGRAAPDGTYGATMLLDIPAAGLWQVALGGPAWIDLVENDGVVASVRHGHGPDCSGIRKIVAFQLEAGRHRLQISGAPEAEISVMVAR